MQNRLIYIDVLRGIAMFTVVYCHLLLFSLEHYTPSWISNFLRLYYLDGFFFLSGFMAYKETNWNMQQFTNYVFKKIKTLLIPTCFCGTIYMITHNVPLIPVLFNNAKYGYWFTYTLFLMFCIYAILMLLLEKIKKKNFSSVFFVSFLICILAFNHTSFMHGKVQDLFSLYNLTLYLPLFLLGILCKRHYFIFHNKITGSNLGKFILFGIIISSHFIYIPYFIMRVAIVFFFYAIIRDLIKNDGLLFRLPIKALSYIGRFTLEIYFIHYFILFPLPSFLSSYFIQLSSCDRSLSFPEFLIVGSISFVICIASIVIANLVKLIPYVGMLAFGKKGN